MFECLLKIIFFLFFRIASEAAKNVIVDSSVGDLVQSVQHDLQELFVLALLEFDVKKNELETSGNFGVSLVPLLNL